MPMKNLPVLTVTKSDKPVTYCQSGAIARYLARKFDLYGSSEEENLVIEEVYDSVGDVRTLFVQRHFATDPRAKESLYKKNCKSNHSFCPGPDNVTIFSEATLEYLYKRNITQREATMPAMEAYTLTYFNARGGGEIVRLIFAAAGVSYTDRRLDREDWPQFKAAMPMKNLPVLTVTKSDKPVTYCQSGAIARYLARKFDLYGSSEEENLVIEEVYDSVGDVRTLFVQRHFATDPRAKESLYKKITTTTLPNFSAYFLRRKADNGCSKFVVGSKLTLADLAVFNLVDGLVELGLSSVLEPYPHLLEHREDMLTLDSLNTWVHTRPKTDV